VAHNPYAEWYQNTMHVAGSPTAEHHAREHGGAPYSDFQVRSDIV
jgi:alpha-L-fucosidase